MSWLGHRESEDNIIYADLRRSPPPSPSPTYSKKRVIEYQSRIIIGVGCALWLLYSLFHRPGPSPRMVTMGKTLTVSNYTVVQGLFVHSDPEVKDAGEGEGYDILDDSFGLIDKSPDRWQRFAQHIDRLNREADDKTTYKVIYLARHGQGVHNVAEQKYGAPEWNCKWSLLETDGELVWGPDPLLTTKGEDQVARTREAWEREIEAGIPLPQVLYSSPLRRAIDTLELTWNGISQLPKDTPRKIKENLREMIGLHTCDKRSTRTILEEAYPHYELDGDFTDADQLWTPHYQEQPPQIALRARLLLNTLFAQDASTYISITGHGGIIGGLLQAVGHRKAAVETGGVIPIVVRATSDTNQTMIPIEGGQSATAPTCSSTSTQTSKEIARETRGVEQDGDLVIRSA